MAKNFDEMLSDERTFTVRGEKFDWRDVRPEILSTFDIATNGDDPNAVWKLMDAQILLFIEPEQHERWAKLRERDEQPVTIAQLTAIVQWLMEEQTDRPTNQPSPSASGRGKTAASSRAA